MTTAARSRADGFSLVELVVAMAVTLIVSGAIYGLLSGGQSAFRREPELSDRQQNIRVAMSVIQKDMDTAGIGMGAFFQIFTPALDGVGATPGLNGPTDHLQLFGNDGKCPDVDTRNGACPGEPGGTGNTCPVNGSNLNTRSPIPGCYNEDAFVLVVYGRNGQEIGGRWGFGHNIHSHDDMLNFPSGQQPPGSQITNNDELKCFDGTDDASCDRPIRLSAVSVYRYEIANDPEGVPGLWRSTTGGTTPGGGGYVAAPDPDGQWQLIARGIEDMQVRYRTGAGWVDNPGVPADPNYATIVREVRVTLSARSTAANLTGQRRAANAALGAAQDAVRGSLTSTMAVRSTLFYMSQAGQWQ